MGEMSGDRGGVVFGEECLEIGLGWCCGGRAGVFGGGGGEGDR